MAWSRSKWGRLFAASLGLAAFCCFAAAFAEAPNWARLALVGGFLALWERNAFRQNEANDDRDTWTDTDDFVELWYAVDEPAKQKLRDRWRNQGLGTLANDPRIIKKLVGQLKKI